MVLLKIIHVTEKKICCILGFSSPWVTNVCNPSILDYIQFIIGFLLPLICVHKLNQQHFYMNHISKYLSSSSMSLVILEMYVNIASFTKLNKRCTRIISNFLKINESLETVILPLIKKTNPVKFITHLFFYFTNVFSICIPLYVICVKREFMFIVFIVRYIIVGPVNLQWLLFTHEIDTHLSRVKYYVKSNLVANTSDVSCRCDSIQFKRIQFEIFDNAVNVYRMLLQKHKLLNEYYGIHMCLDVSLHIYGSVLITYCNWLDKTNEIMGNNVLYLLTLAWDLASVLLPSMISESVAKKVSFLTAERFTVYKLINAKI